MITAQNVIDQALEFIQEKEGVFFKTNELYSALNAGIKNFCAKSRLLKDFITLNTPTTFAMNFPDNIMAFTKIQLEDGSILTNTVFKNGLDLYQKAKTESGTPTGFIQNENTRKIYFYPKPDRVYSIDCEVIYYPTAVSPESQNIGLPYEYEQAFVDYMIWYMWRKDKEELAAAHYKLYVSEIVKARSSALGMNDNIIKSSFPLNLRRT